jgi:alkylation response protein AidB-like acyl-CoA dehydrogenase
MLEHLLGEPWDPHNPVGLLAVLAADERAEPLAAGERILDEIGLRAHVVPATLGGRLTGLDHLFQLLRAVCRRDPALGFGYGLNSLMAGVNIWTSGSPGQQRALADLLLAGRQVACAYHELDHGNDLARMDLSATPGGGGWQLNGRKEMITNIARADAIVLYARTSTQPGSRSHSQFYLTRSELERHSYRMLPRYRTAGLRGVQLAGIEFFDSRVPADRVVGRAGLGLETAMRSFQITRVAVPAMAIGAADLALREGVRYARGRRLYGRAVADLPLVRSELATTFADLLVADCLTAVGTRMLHLRPHEGSTVAAACKYLAPHLLIAGVRRLSSVLGSQFYLRSGEHGVLQKLVRDLQPTAFVHASAATCQLTLLPQLPLLARRAWRPASEPDPGPFSNLFRIGAALPPVDFGALTVGSAGADSLVAALPWARDRYHERLARSRGGPNRPAELIGVLLAELAELTDDCAGLRPNQTGATAMPAAYRLAHRYAVLLAASACLHVWAEQLDDAAAFDRDERWLTAVLTRLTGAAGRTTGALPEDVAGYLFEELTRRYEEDRTLDLLGAPLRPRAVAPASCPAPTAAAGVRR